jgi:hypothetical protein
MTDDFRRTFHNIGMESLNAGEMAVITMAAGSGSRWTKGAGVVKAINPFCKMNGKHRTFLEVHLAKHRRTGAICKKPIPYILTTSYMTQEPISEFLKTAYNYYYPGSLYLSPGQSVGLRMIPMSRDLRYLWEETSQQILDEQAQKVLESQRNATLNWVLQMGEGNDYIDNTPFQCLHPVGHWYEIPNMLLNGTMKKLLEDHPHIKYLLIHNIDTVGVEIDPAILGYHISQKCVMTVEVIPRCIDDHGGGLARVDGQLRLVEGLTIPRQEIEFELSYYNSNTMWLDLDQILQIFSLKRGDLNDRNKILESVRKVAGRMPTYVTLKEVKRRWGKGQEDIYPVTQFEKLWGDMTGLKELKSQYIEVSRYRGQQLKDPAQLDGWLRDGSAAYVESLCTWE